MKTILSKRIRVKIHVLQKKSDLRKGRLIVWNIREDGLKIISDGKSLRDRMTGSMWSGWMMMKIWTAGRMQPPGNKAVRRTSLKRSRLR